MGANPVQIEVGDFDEAIEIVEDEVVESKSTQNYNPGSLSRQEVNDLHLFILFFYHNVGFMDKIQINNVAPILQQRYDNVATRLRQCFTTMLQQRYNYQSVRFISIF